jgi:hypothetical protein
MSDEVEVPAFRVVGKGRVLIVKGAPGPAELLRSEPFVNDERALLEKHVLAPLGLKRDDVLLAWCDSMHGGDEALAKFVDGANPDVLISMSVDTAFVKDKRSWNLPTLHELRDELAKYGGEQVRKLTAIRKRLDATAHRKSYSVQLVEKGATPTDDAAILTPIHKANAAKQIVYGVVLDPYQVDTQEDWCPPAEIEKTAHEFMARSRTIGLHHVEVAPDATLVESSVEQYPSDTDRQKAHENKPHRVYARKYGQDVVHSGAWIMGVKLSDRLWKMYESGELGAFSIEGFGKRVPVAMSEMPEVTFVEIGEVGSAKGRTSQEAH